jgi:hypothetical protein
MKEMERLGRPGAYRLGDLRARGAEPVPPRPARPAFARASRRGSLSAWALAFVAGVAAVTAGALAGLFFVPLLVGLLAGIILALAGVGLGLVLAARWASRAQVQVDDARPGGGESGDLVRLLAVSPGPGVASAPTRGAG